MDFLKQLSWITRFSPTLTVGMFSKDAKFLMQLDGVVIAYPGYSKEGLATCNPTFNRLMIEEIINPAI